MAREMTTETMSTGRNKGETGTGVSSAPLQSATMSCPPVSIIVPTYREAENLPTLCARIFSATRASGIDAEVIVVDDNSPDDTVAVMEALGQKYPARLLVRTNERGLSSAVIHGMVASNRPILVCMDADLSHPPEQLPAVIDAVASGGADFCIGSRYVPGGSTSENWGVLRWLNSKIATVLAAPLVSARDPMAGFFCLRRDTFDAARANGLKAIGYKIGLEICVRSRCNRIQEVPIRFEDRQMGESKLGIGQQIAYLGQLAHLYWARFPIPLVAVLVFSLVAFAASLLIVW
jgi:dolichol-phosphate mannosyltransferase